MNYWSNNVTTKIFNFWSNRCIADRSTIGLAKMNKSLFTGCWFVSAVATADAIISISCAGVVGMLRVGSVTALATTLNYVGADEEEEDTAPELFLPLREAIRRDSSSATDM